MGTSLTEEQRIECERTRRGVCARCDNPPSCHPEGKCPDGRGSFTWSQTRDDVRRTIAGLEAMQKEFPKAQARRAAMTDDQRLLLDTIVEQSFKTFGGAPVGARELAALLDWDIPRVRRVAEELRALRCITGGIPN